MHKKIAKKYMSRLLCDHLQKAVSTAKVDLGSVKGLTERAVSLIDASEHREDIYRQAGDMVFMYQTKVESLFEHMAVIEYLVGKMALSSAADDLKPAFRKELDKALKDGA